MFSSLCVYAQIANPNANAVYDGFVNSYLIGSGDGTKTPYFCQTLKNRNRAFFWQQAYLITACEDAYDRAPSASRKQFITDLLNKLLIQDGTNWTWDSWNDDMQWAMIACIRGYQITGLTIFRDAAVNNWNLCYNRGWDITYGGGIWEDNSQIPNGGKCGLSNWPQIIPGCLIYESLIATNPTTANDILSKCKGIYAWGRTHLWDPSTGRVYEGYYPDPKRNFSGDDNSYNYGLLTNSAASLYKITKDKMYLADAIRVADANIAKINSKSAGIMTEDKYWNGGFGGEQLARGLAKLANENFLWNKYWQFLSNNCTAAWNHRIPNYNFTRNNFSVQSTYVDSIMAMELTGCVSIQQVTPVIQPLSGTIIATNYNYMKGILTETCSEGGLNITGIETGDWIDYVMNIPKSNTYTITYRVAGTNDGAVSLLQNADTLSTTILPATGGVQTWADVSTVIYLKSGIHSIRLAAKKGGWKISNWSVKSCQTIVPSVSINGAAAISSVLATLSVGGSLKLMPQPADGTWSWTGPNGFTAKTRELSFTNIQQEQGGIYTATYTCPEGSTSYQDFIVTLNGCTSTAIEPSVKVNKNGSWQQLTTVSSQVGDTVFFSPKPLGGIWKWTGPNGFIATTREVQLNDIANKQAGNYTATYFNSNGCKSTQVFTVGVTGDDICGTPIVTYLSVNDGIWQQVDNVTLNIGGKIIIGPQPTDGSWSWTGPNGFVATGRELTLTGFTAQQAGYYTAKYTNSAGCVRYKKVIVGAKNCEAISIVPVIQVNGVTTLRSDSITVKSGDNVTITSPVADGIWQWTGPNNFTSNVNQISINRILISSSGKYTVTYFNASGCKSSYMINIKIPAGDDYCGTAIIPYLNVNGGGWFNVANASLNTGGNLKFGPQPIDGYWQWAGPAGFTAIGREITLSAITVAKAGVYSASRTSSAGCMSFLNFKVTVDGVSDVGVVDAENSDMYIYPNPATDIVTVKNVPANTTITVFDLSGRIVLSLKSSDVLENTKINVSNLNTGVYFVKIENLQVRMLKLLKK